MSLTFHFIKLKKSFFRAETFETKSVQYIEDFHLSDKMKYPLPENACLQNLILWFSFICAVLILASNLQKSLNMKRRKKDWRGVIGVI